LGARDAGEELALPSQPVLQTEAPSKRCARCALTWMEHWSSRTLLSIPADLVRARPLLLFRWLVI